MDKNTRICQIALSVIDLPQSINFYQTLFSLLPAGQTKGLSGELASAVQGLDNVVTEVAWLVDDRDFFQLELFNYEHPTPQPYAQHRSPEDIGYSRIAFEVADIEQLSQSVELLGGSIVSPIEGDTGKRQFFCKDPNAILIQVSEAELPAGVRARVSGIAASVPSLEIAKQDFSSTLGFDIASSDGNATKQTVVLDGETIWLELNEYQTPISRLWPPAYQLCDYGILNIAIGYRDLASFQTLYERCMNAGFTADSKPVQLPGAEGVTYVYDRQQFSVEMFCLDPDFDAAYGFKPIS
jgi:catechol 2,3-dioxygenase-like lactoylglutathione lyase family enzyme